MVVAVWAVVVVVGLAVVVLVGLGAVVEAGLAEVVPAECEFEPQASALTASTATIVNSQRHLRLLCMIRTPPNGHNHSVLEHVAPNGLLST